MLSKCLQTMCQSVSHWVVDAAYPAPRELLVYPGVPGTMERAIVEAVLAHVHHDALVQCALGGKHPSLSIDGDTPVTGCFATCRYLGKLWRLYPLNPKHALIVDGLLDCLSPFLAPTDTREPEELQDMLEELCCGDNVPWLEGLGGPTMADACWRGALAWLIDQKLQHPVDGATHPRLARWWAAWDEKSKHA